MEKLAVNKGITILILLLGWGYFGRAQDRLHEPTWKELKKKISYDKMPKQEPVEYEYEEVPEFSEESEGNRKLYSEEEVTETDQWLDKESPFTKDNIPKPIDGENSSGTEQETIESSESETEYSFPSWLKIVGIILIALLIALVIYRVINNQKKDSYKKIKTVSEDRPPQEITRTELELALEKALEVGNYREAIRIYFVHVIKVMSENGWIEWHKQKTNAHYLQEMLGKKTYPLFAELTAVFEYVWYGKRKISAIDFEQVEPKFKSLIHDSDKANG